MDKPFLAFFVDKKDDLFTAQIKETTIDALPEGDCLIKVAYSSVNYKDALAGIPNGKIVKNYPFIPGIDLAGTIVRSSDPRFKEGDHVIATSYEIGVSHYGGFSEYARIPGDWIVPLPEGLTMEEAMIYGTAGFTAALSIHRLEENGLTPDKGEVLVTGATGGVGSIATAMLANKGYEVIASTGKETEHDFLKELGAKTVISREEVCGEHIRPLDKQLFAAAVDPVGGRSLAAVLSKIKYGGAVAVSGLTGGSELPGTVFPFILRGVDLLGIDSVYCPMPLRKEIWNKMAGEYKPSSVLHRIKRTITLKELPDTLNMILKGEARGRNIVKI